MALYSIYDQYLRFAGNASTIFCSGLLLFLTYAVSLAVRRLYFDPLAAFPGPKLAAATFWVETYYDLVHKGGGQFHFQIRRWHDIYGPIIRINPDELHVSDPEFYDTIYHTSRPFDKLKRFEKRFDTPLATFSTTEHELHRPRRMALAPFFSKKRVMEFTPIIHSRVDQLIERLRRDFVDKDRVVDLSDMWACLISDMVTTFAFDHSYDLINEPNFQNPFIKGVKMLGDMVHWATQFPWLLDLTHYFPDHIVAMVIPPAKIVFYFRKTMRDRILESQERVQENPDKAMANPILFDELLKSSLPPCETGMARMSDEAFGITAAGTETTRWTLSVACFHIFNDASIYTTLMQELREAIPNPDEIPPLSKLEQLPYLTGCIEEAIRLAYGCVSRSPRVSQNDILYYGEYTIPAGTPVSIETYTMHHNEKIFPDSFSFVPSRWLKDATARHQHRNGNDTDSGKKENGLTGSESEADHVASQPQNLSRYMTSFGKGSRSCLGMTLTYAELYIALATVLRRLRFELYETDVGDVECQWAVVISRPRRDTKGVRAKIYSR